MAIVPAVEGQIETQTDRYPLLMERSSNNNADEHVIDIGSVSNPCASMSHGIDHSNFAEPHNENRTPASQQAPIMPLSSSVPVASNSRNISLTRRNENYGRRSRSPLNSGLWISIELLVNMSQIIAAIIVLSMSRHEDPQTPLFAWIVGYTLGCFFTLPHLYWRYIHRSNQGSGQESPRSHQSNTQNNPPEATSYSVVSVNQAVEEGRNRNAVSRFRQSLSSPRFIAYVDHFKMALDCFFAVWFVVGNVWVFGGHTAVSAAPNLYRLCIVFLTFSCIGYAMPFILCAMICCCLPCIISIVGLREDMGQTRGATEELIDALPTYKYKPKRSENGEESDINLDSPSEGGILAAGTDKERIISAEDAVCCICLAKYVDDDELRELPCAHFFHKDCVDRWLKINALCPLCKFDVGTTSSTTSNSNSDRRHNERRVGSGPHPEQEVQ